MRKPLKQTTAGMRLHWVSDLPRRSAKKTFWNLMRTKAFCAWVFYMRVRVVASLRRVVRQGSDEALSWTDNPTECYTVGHTLLHDDNTWRRLAVNSQRHRITFHLRQTLPTLRAQAAGPSHEGMDVNCPLILGLCVKFRVTYKTRIELITTRESRSGLCKVRRYAGIGMRASYGA